MRLFQSGFNAFLCLLLLLILFALLQPWWSLPPEWNPRTPLSLNDPVTPVTRWKLQQLRNSPQECLALLDSAADDSLKHTPLADYTPVKGCPLSNVVRIERTSVGFNAPFTLTCPVAVSWLMFERQRLQPLAEQHLGSPLARIEHFGTFACRNIYHREAACRSAYSRTGATKRPPTNRYFCTRLTTPPAITSAPFWVQTTTPHTPIIFISTTATSATAANSCRTGVLQCQPLLPALPDR